MKSKLFKGAKLSKYLIKKAVRSAWTPKDLATSSGDGPRRLVARRRMVFAGCGDTEVWAKTSKKAAMATVGLGCRVFGPEFWPTNLRTRGRLAL